MEENGRSENMEKEIKGEGWERGGGRGETKEVALVTSAALLRTPVSHKLRTTRESSQWE